ncbi:MAG: hypothetical protein PVSMB9_02050 [Candidatus Dormibacteria bacterium]
MERGNRREILTKVARGELSPQEAAEQLTQAEAESEAGTSSVARIRVDGQLGSLQILGDPTVREAVASGPHRARVEGDTLIIEGEHRDAGGFTFSGHLPFSWAAAGDRRLVIRMNPALALELAIQAGSCLVRGIEGPIRADVQAGSLKIDGLRGPIQASVQAGSLKAAGVLSQGASRITCEAGSVSIHLERGSDVRISARASLGKVTLPGTGGGITRGGASEATVGTGQASLQIESMMGSVIVSAGA